MIEGKQREKILLNKLTKWLKEWLVSDIDALRAMRGRGAWKLMIAYDKEQSIWLVDYLCSLFALKKWKKPMPKISFGLVASFPYYSLALCVFLIVSRQQKQMQNWMF